MSRALVEKRIGVLKIRAALRDLKSKWLPNREFMRAYNISPSAITRYGYMFEDYRVVYNQTFFWSGSKQTIRRLEKRINDSQEENSC